MTKSSAALNWRKSDDSRDPSADQQARPTPVKETKSSGAPLIRILFTTLSEPQKNDEFDMMLFFEHKDQTKPYAPNLTQAVVRYHGRLVVKAKDVATTLSALIKSTSSSIVIDDKSMLKNLCKQWGIDTEFQGLYEVSQIVYRPKEHHKPGNKIGNLTIYFYEKDNSTHRIAINIHLHEYEATSYPSDPNFEINQLGFKFKTLSKCIEKVAEKIKLKHNPKLFDLDPFCPLPKTIQTLDDESYQVSLTHEINTIKTFSFLARGFFSDLTREKPDADPAEIKEVYPRTNDFQLKIRNLASIISILQENVPPQTKSLVSVCVDPLISDIARILHNKKGAQKESVAPTARLS